MRLDLPLHTIGGDPGHSARVLAELGVSGAYSFEGPNDVFVPLIRAAGADLDLYSNIAVSFPRSPVHLAHTAWDLARLTSGRFFLGLGSQIRPHIERRYGSVFDHPAARMADQVDAIKAIFARWQDGTPLDHRGRFWTIDLMPPLFDPGPLVWGPPPVLVAAVGPLMTKAAVEHADGILLHPFTTDAFVDQDSLAQIAQSQLAQSQIAQPGPTDSFTVIGGSIVALAGGSISQHDADEAARGLVAFYGSTPAYRPVLEREGLGELQPLLRVMTKENRWEDMAELISDEVLDLIVIRGQADEVAERLRRRFGDRVDRVGVTIPHHVDPAVIEDLVRALAT